MTKKEAMIILGNASLLNKISSPFIKHIYYHPKDSEEKAGVRLTKTEAVSIIVSADLIYAWESVDGTLRYGPPPSRGKPHFAKSLQR